MAHGRLPALLLVFLSVVIRLVSSVGCQQQPLPSLAPTPTPVPAVSTSTPLPLAAATAPPTRPPGLRPAVKASTLPFANPLVPGEAWYKEDGQSVSLGNQSFKLVFLKRNGGLYSPVHSASGVDLRAKRDEAPINTWVVKLTTAEGQESYVASNAAKSKGIQLLH